MVHPYVKTTIPILHITSSINPKRNRFFMNNL